MQWNGPWSERSWEWDSLSDRDKELLSVRVRNEGEFWMSFDDFAKQFSHLDLVSREDMLKLDDCNCAVKRSIGFTISFHNHGEGPY